MSKTKQEETKRCETCKHTNLMGMRFGKLTVLRSVGRDKNRNIIWECICDCGNKTIVTATHLRNNKTKSCGCYRHDNFVIINTIHGLKNHPLYTVWKGIKQRCYNKNNNAYNHYGGRGIIMCDEWKNDFKAFYDWSIEYGYKNGLSVDRINNNGIYEPNNCRFVTMKEQQRNRRNNHLITYKNNTKTLSEWCEILNLKYHLIRERIYVLNWNADKAFETKKIMRGVRRVRN